MNRFEKMAFGKPKDIKGVGKVINTGSRIGTRIIQGLFLRPGVYGYRAVKKK